MGFRSVKGVKSASSGFGIVGWAFLCLVLYLFVSLAIGFSTNDTRCGIGKEREWRYAPPGWVCR